jgi:hypothetical protein
METVELDSARYAVERSVESWLGLVESGCLPFHVLSPPAHRHSH